MVAYADCLAGTGSNQFITDSHPPIWQVIFSIFPETTAPKPGLGIFYKSVEGQRSFAALTTDHEMPGLHLLPGTRKHRDGTYLLLQVF